MKVLTTITLRGSQSGSGRTRSDRQRPAAGCTSVAGHSFRNTPTIPVCAITRVGKAQRAHPSIGLLLGNVGGHGFRLRSL